MVDFINIIVFTKGIFMNTMLKKSLLGMLLIVTCNPIKAGPPAGDDIMKGLITIGIGIAAVSAAATGFIVGPIAYFYGKKAGKQESQEQGKIQEQENQETIKTLRANLEECKNNKSPQDFFNKNSKR